MGAHMKTTIEINDSLLRKAKAAAQREGTTVRELVERGLRQVLKEQQGRPTFKLRDASFSGAGPTPEQRGESWDEIRDAIYEGRGS
jgi:hypothetical protein